MKRDRNEPITESRFEQSQRKNNSGPLLKFAFIILAIGLLAFWLMQDLEPIKDEFVEDQEAELAIAEEERATELNKEQITRLKEKLQKEIEVKEEKEGTTADFYYQRALKKENNKQYKGALQDYTKAIGLAKKYSFEMWNSLNNRGIIKAQQYKNYKGAKADFTKIITIENNRYDGEINETSLEAAFTNRAYVKRQLGDNDGACDDLYEALGLGVETSVAFIEKQIDKNCL